MKLKQLNKNENNVIELWIKLLQSEGKCWYQGTISATISLLSIGYNQLSKKALAADNLFSPFAGPMENNGLEMNPFTDHPVIFTRKLGDFDIFSMNDKGQNVLIA